MDLLKYLQTCVDTQVSFELPIIKFLCIFYLKISLAGYSKEYSHGSESIRSFRSVSMDSKKEQVCSPLISSPTHLRFLSSRSLIVKSPLIISSFKVLVSE